MTSCLKPIIDRMMDKIQKDLDTDCWLWQGTKTRNGYGFIYYKKSNRVVHRVMAELKGIIEDIDQKVEVHHTCPNYNCINPAHLKLGSASNRIRKKPPKPRALNPNPSPKPFPKPFKPPKPPKKVAQKPTNERVRINTLYVENPVKPIGEEHVREFINNWRESHARSTICVRCWQTVLEEDLKKHESIHNRKKRRKKPK